MKVNESDLQNLFYCITTLSHATASITVHQTVQWSCILVCDKSVHVSAFVQWLPEDQSGIKGLEPAVRRYHNPHFSFCI